MFRIIFISLMLLSLFACRSSEQAPLSSAEVVIPKEALPITAVDISSYPEIALTEPSFYTVEGVAQDFLLILKDQGVNTLRLRLWVNPDDGHSGFAEVKSFSENLRALGFKIWLSLHYSDDWADPGQQRLPAQWEGSSFEDLQDSVYQYTAKVVRTMQPDYIQIGNEINTGFLHPYGHFTNQFAQCYTLLETGIRAVRDEAIQTQIMLHFAGYQGADDFFAKLSGLDYDIIGLSYYPRWHGKSITGLASTMELLSTRYDKAILIAEMAYPFTLDWNDWTNNLVGTEEQLILPDYPATPLGQEQFVRRIKTLCHSLDKGLGFCYWGAELIAWKGPQATDGSPWENQALFDFEQRALPALGVFGEE